MGAEFIASMLGLPDDSWAYLDLPSTFDHTHRPVNYSPVMRMNAKTMATEEGRRPMQNAIDHIISWYLQRGTQAGVVHTVSNKYRDNVLTESRFRAIMTSSVEEHENRVHNEEASVLVAANVAEGWDGVDKLCRFVIMPKVPFPYLGDPRVAARKEADGRTFDHAALVGVVQGAGRGVRHKEDYADTWILDQSWGFLHKRRKSWLPKAFLDSYHHGVALP